MSTPSETFAHPGNLIVNANQDRVAFVSVRSRVLDTRDIGWQEAANPGALWEVVVGIRDYLVGVMHVGLGPSVV